MKASTKALTMAHEINTPLPKEAETKKNIKIQKSIHYEINTFNELTFKLKESNNKLSTLPCILIIFIFISILKINTFFCCCLVGLVGQMNPSEHHLEFLGLNISLLLIG